MKRAQQRLHFLRQLRKFNLPQQLLKQFYSAIIEFVLCTSITVWFSSATKSDHRRLQRVVRTAERIIGTTLPTLQELYLSRVSKRAGKITLDPSHPARGDSRIVLMGWHRGGQDPVRGGPWEKSCAPTQVGWHKKGTAQVPGQLISLFINKNHLTDNTCSQLLSLSKQTVCVCVCVSSELL